MSGMSMMALFAVFTSTSRSSSTFYVRHGICHFFAVPKSRGTRRQIGSGFFQLGVIYFLVVADGEDTTKFQSLCICRIVMRRQALIVFKTFLNLGVEGHNALALLAGFA